MGKALTRLAPAQSACRYQRLPACDLIVADAPRYKGAANGHPAHTVFRFRSRARPLLEVRNGIALAVIVP